MFGEGTAPHGNGNFVSGEIIKKTFQSRYENLVIFDKKPERSNRKIFSLVYCPKNGCSESFEIHFTFGRICTCRQS